MNNNILSNASAIHLWLNPNQKFRGKIKIFNYRQNSKYLANNWWIEAFNIAAVTLEAFIMLIEVLQIFILHFVAFHLIGISWNLLYQLSPSVRTNILFKSVASIVSLVFLMIGVINLHLTSNAENQNQRYNQIQIWNKVKNKFHKL